MVRGALAGLFPGQVPAPLAVEPERGWMVLADFGGEVGWEAPLEVHQAVSYRSLATRPPGDPHMAQSTAWWLRQVLAGLA